MKLLSGEAASVCMSQCGTNWCGMSQCGMSQCGMLSVGRGQGASAGPQNKATTFSSTPSLFLTLPLKIIAARNHTSATFNSGEAGCKQLAVIPIFASIINVALFTN